MSSLSGIQQVFTLLQEVDRLLDVINVKATVAEQQVTRLNTAMNTFHQLERVALRYLALARRMGLPEEVNAAINTMTRLITIIRMAQLATNLLLATNPLTAIVGIPALLLTTISFGDLLAGY